MGFQDWQECRPEPGSDEEHPDGARKLAGWYAFVNFLLTTMPTPPDHVDELDRKAYQQASDDLNALKDNAPRGLQRFYEIPARLESKAIFVCRFSMTTPGQRLDAALARLSEGDVLDQVVSCAVRSDHAPKGGLTKALEQFLK